MEILGTTEISYEIEQMLKEPKEFLILVTPYLKLNQRLKVKLADAFHRLEKVFVLYRDNQNDISEIEWFKEFAKVELFAVQNLHSKIYINEKTAIIASMNLYEYSQINNHEIGVKFDLNSDKKEYERCLDEVRIIVETEYSKDDLIEFYNAIHSVKDYSMRKLFFELTNQYSFENFNIGSRSQRLYEFISDKSREIMDFTKDELWKDGSLILRDANLGKKRYELLKKELSKFAKK
ncbi:MAG: phospholipase D family protein [Flavobacteriaceae bacterium]|nr:phospholipase D family protein [Flavobacteriaceae bacterium]